ncbi:MAG TPA: hypothetical protein VMT27_02550 [Actinomycetes bacterium]|nr:hypothetical protein [Actinomycetes bacterium]
MVLRPVGPLPPAAYWLRRLLVLCVIVIIVAVPWWLFTRAGGNTPAGATPTVTPPVTTSGSTSTAETTPEQTPSKTTSSSQTPVSAPPCANKDLSVSVATNAESYAAGRQPTFTLTVENVSDAACSRDLGQDALELLVSSGGSPVWSSDDCNPGGQPKISVLRPGDPSVESVQWSRVQSQPGCPTPQDSAAPGQYQVVARNLEIISDPAVFTLE